MNFNKYCSWKRFWHVCRRFSRYLQCRHWKCTIQFWPIVGASLQLIFQVREIELKFCSGLFIFILRTRGILSRIWFGRQFTSEKSKVLFKHRFSRITNFRDCAMLICSTHTERIAFKLKIPRVHPIKWYRSKGFQISTSSFFHKLKSESNSRSRFRRFGD